MAGDRQIRLTNIRRALASRPSVACCTIASYARIENLRQAQFLALRSSFFRSYHPLQRRVPEIKYGAQWSIKTMWG